MSKNKTINEKEGAEFENNIAKGNPNPGILCQITNLPSILSVDDFFLSPYKLKPKSKTNRTGRIIKEPIKIINHLGSACPATPQTGFFGLIAYSQSKGNFSFAPIRSGLYYVKKKIKTSPST